MELFLLKPKEMLQIPTESVKWSGSRYGAARKIDAQVLWRKSPGREIVKVVEGDTLLFKWKNKELFRGVVFNCAKTKSGLMTVTAYDVLQYLLLSKDVYVFSKKRADQIAERIMKDFEIPHTKLANTGYVFKTLVFANEMMLYDMILQSLKTTKKQNGKHFYLSASKGKVSLREVKTNSTPWIVAVGENLIDFTYTTSIEDTTTRVKLVAGEEKKQISAVVTDEAGKKKYGVIQKFEKVTDKVNKAQLQTRAKNVLKQNKGVKKELSVDALGIPELISNQTVRVIEKDLGINKNFFIDTDTHEFSGNKHTMSLKLIEKNDMPEGA